MHDDGRLADDQSVIKMNVRCLMIMMDDEWMRNMKEYTSWSNEDDEIIC